MPPGEPGRTRDASSRGAPAGSPRLSFHSATKTRAAGTFRGTASSSCDVFSPVTPPITTGSTHGAATDDFATWHQT